MSDAIQSSYALTLTDCPSKEPMVKLKLVWTLADMLNGLMAIPNLIALLLLSPVIFSVTRDYFKRHDQ